MKTFVIDGSKMAYLDVGQGPVILFGHSYLWNSAMWSPQIEVLSQSFRCIVPDMWGHGQSEGTPQSTTDLGGYAAQLLALMDELNIDQFSVVGLSVGGMWGAELATMAPSRVMSLVLLDTFVGLEPQVANEKYYAMLSTIEQEKAFTAEVIEALARLNFANASKKRNPELVEGFTESLSAIKGSRALELARVGRMIFGRRDLCDDVETLALPTLVAVGAEDKMRPALESYLMHDLITGSELHVIPNAGHISNLEQPDIVTSLLERFLVQHANELDL
jgi:pimeloyl-ACP methyl ester carboxylesterase